LSRGDMFEFQEQPCVTDDQSCFFKVYVVIITLKAQRLPAIAPKLAPLLGPNTSLVTAQNGFPWWYFHGLASPWRGMRLEAVDPGGVISKAIDPARVIGCVVYPSTALVEPGIVWHIEGTRFAIRQPHWSKSHPSRRLPHHPTQPAP